MILVFEMNCAGTMHAPGNSATVQTIAQGFPNQGVRVFAEASHLSELKRDPAFASYQRITCHPIAHHPDYPGRLNIVTPARFRHEFRLIRRALADVPAGEPCVIVLISATSTSIFAAAIAARLRGSTMVQVGLHGELHDILGWRSRNPLARAFDLRSAMQRPWRQLRFLVLEQAIKAELAHIAPAAALRTDVLPLPINVAELPDAALTLSAPVRIGFVGQATEAKGIGVFLDIARAMKARHGDKVEFHVIGRAYPGAAMPDFSPLAHPIATDYLPRDDFVRRIAALHYVCLPLTGEYYRFAASGALIDAVTWLKPVITCRVPIATSWFDSFGDIGHLCDDAAMMQSTINTILRDMNATRYAAQVGAMQRARASRTPEALGKVYAGIIGAHFPEFARQ